jgi:hypothetical protein
MNFGYIKPLGSTLEEFLIELSKEDKGAGLSEHSVNPLLLGKEVHEVHPVVFGGDPSDPRNKVFLRPEEYAPFVVWWNRKYRELKRE